MTRPSFPFIYTFHLASSHLSCLSAAKVLHQMLQDEGFQAARQRLYSYQDVPQDMLAATQAAKVTLVLPLFGNSKMLQTADVACMA